MTKKSRIVIPVGRIWPIGPLGWAYCLAGTPGMAGRHTRPAAAADSRGPGCAVAGLLPGGWRRLVLGLAMNCLLSSRRVRGRTGAEDLLPGPPDGAVCRGRPAIGVAAGLGPIPGVDFRRRHVGAVAATRENPVRISLFGLIYLAIGLVVALTHGYNSVAGLSEILSLIIAVVLWPAVLFGVDLHLPAIAT